MGPYIWCLWPTYGAINKAQPFVTPLFIMRCLWHIKFAKTKKYQETPGWCYDCMTATSHFTLGCKE